jgi:hypothetical protein
MTHAQRDNAAQRQHRETLVVSVCCTVTSYGLGAFGQAGTDGKAGDA